MMPNLRRRKIKRILFVTLILSIFTGLVLYALSENISLFYTPTQIQKGEAPVGVLMRVGGLVKRGSMAHSKNNVLELQFQLTDLQSDVQVLYEGTVPDLFREGQGVVVKGHLLANHQFQAVELLAKHDENYMPPELKNLPGLKSQRTS